MSVFLFTSKKPQTIPKQFSCASITGYNLRLNTGIDPTPHRASEQWTFLARRSEYRWDIGNRSPASSSVVEIKERR